MGVSPRNYSPRIAEIVRCVSLLFVSIVLFFFDVSVSYRIYYMYHGFSVYMDPRTSILALGFASGQYIGARVLYSPYIPRSHGIYITYTIVNRNIKDPTGHIYGIYPRPQGSYTTAGKLYNHIKVRSRVQQGYMPYIIPGMKS